MLCSMKLQIILLFSQYYTNTKIMIEQKQLENVEYFKYSGSILTNDGRYTCEIKSRIAMAKAAFNKKKNLFTSKLDLELRKKLVKFYIWSIALYGAETLTLRAVDQKHLVSFEMDKDGKDQLDRSCEKWRSIT